MGEKKKTGTEIMNGSSRHTFLPPLYIMPPPMKAMPEGHAADTRAPSDLDELASKANMPQIVNKQQPTWGEWSEGEWREK